MTNVLLFIGAGASKPLGIPTTIDFVEEFAKEIEREKLPKEQIDFYNLMQKLLNNNYKPNNDIEGVLTILDNFAKKITFRDLGATATFYYIRYLAKLIKEKFGEVVPSTIVKAQKPKDIETAKVLREKLKAYVWKRCQEANTSKVLSVYDAFFDALAEGSAHHFVAPNSKQKIFSGDIFTTNYDLCIETYYRIRGASLNNGVAYDDALGMPLLKFENYNKGGQVRLFKMHGSVNLHRLKSGHIAEFLIPPSSKRTPYGDEIIEEWMIYPIQAKYIYNEPFLSIFNTMKKSLQDAEYTVIVGHSLRDDAIKAIFSDYIKKGILIDPHAGDILKYNAPELQHKIIAIDKEFESPQVLSEVHEILKKKVGPGEWI